MAMALTKPGSAARPEQLNASAQRCPWDTAIPSVQPTQTVSQCSDVLAGTLEIIDVCINRRECLVEMLDKRTAQLITRSVVADGDHEPDSLEW